MASRLLWLAARSRVIPCSSDEGAEKPPLRMGHRWAWSGTTNGTTKAALPRRFVNEAPPPRPIKAEIDPLVCRASRLASVESRAWRAIRVSVDATQAGTVVMKAPVPETHSVTVWSLVAAILPHPPGWHFILLRPR